MASIDNIKLEHVHATSHYDQILGRWLPYQQYKEAECLTLHCDLPPKALFRLHGLNIEPILITLCGACEGNIRNYTSYLKEKYDGRTSASEAD